MFYNNDVLQGYGYNVLFSRPSMVREYFHGKVKFMASNICVSPKVVHDLNDPLQEFCEERTVNGIPVVYIWSRHDKPQDWEDVYAFREKYGDVIKLSDIMLIDDRAMIKLDDRELNLPSESSHTAAVGIMCDDLNQYQNGRLYYHLTSSNHNFLQNTISDVQIFEAGEVDNNPDWVLINIEGVNSVLDAHCELPKYRYDAHSHQLVKKTREEMIDGIAKFWVEKSAVREFGSPSTLLREIDDVLVSVLKSNEEDFMLDEASLAKLRTIVVSPTAFSTHIERVARMQELERGIKAELDTIVPYQL